MEIRKFTEKYLDDMAELFIEAYSEPGYEWDLETAKRYLARNYKLYPDYSLVAIDDEDHCLGGIFGTLIPYYKGEVLFIDSLQVHSDHRRKAIGKTLLRALMDFAKANGVDKVQFIADDRKAFPKDWYEKMGFEKTGWVEYERSI